MTNVNGVQPTVPSKPVEPVHHANAPAAAQGPKQAADVVELSPAAQLVSKVHDIPDVRAELVQRVKAEIAAGTYETPEKIDAAISKLMDEIPNES